MKKTLLKSLTSLLFAMSAVALMATQPPVIELPLDEGDFSAIRDISAFANETIINNLDLGFMTWTQGPLGKALEFNNPDGNHNRGIVKVKAPSQLDVTKGFSFVTTFKTGKGFIKRRIYPVFRFSDALGKGGGVFIFCTWNMLCARTGGSEKTTNLSTNTSEEAIVADRWYRIAVTFDGKRLCIYLNGRLAASGEAYVEVPKYHRYICIGSTGDGAGYGFEGIITQVKVYDRALSPDEITELQLEE